MAASRKWRKYRGWIAAGVLVAIAGAAFVAFRESDTAATAKFYTTEAATQGTLSVTVSGTGNLAVDGATDVTPAVAGTVESIEVTLGAAVSQGDALFTLHSDEVEASIARAYASYQQAFQSVQQSEAGLLKALDSRDQLYTAKAAPDSKVTDASIETATQEVQAAYASRSSAKASFSSAVLAYDQAKAARDDLTVTAPIDGVVDTIDIEIGDSVTASGSGSSSSGTSTTQTTAVSSPSMVIAPQGALALLLTVNEVDLPTLEVGQRADVEFDAFSDLTATGKVYEIASEGVNTQGVVTYDVWIRLDVVDEALRPGMSASATIVTEVAKNALLVPNAAVKTSGTDGATVEVLDAGATEPRSVTVQIGFANATQTQILSGISEGDAVVTLTSDSGSDSTDAQGGGLMLPGMGGGPRG